MIICNRPEQLWRNILRFIMYVFIFNCLFYFDSFILFHDNLNFMTRFDKNQNCFFLS